MNSKMTTNSQLSTIEPKNKNKLSKQLEEEWVHRNRDHKEGYHGEGEGKNWGKGTRNKTIKGRYKIARGRLRTVWEMDKPKNL